MSGPAIGTEVGGFFAKDLLCLDEASFNEVVGDLDMGKTLVPCPMYCRLVVSGGLDLRRRKQQVSAAFVHSEDKVPVPLGPSNHCKYKASQSCYNQRCSCSVMHQLYAQGPKTSCHRRCQREKRVLTGRFTSKAILLLRRARRPQGRWYDVESEGEGNDRARSPQRPNSVRRQSRSPGLLLPLRLQGPLPPAPAPSPSWSLAATTLSM